MLTSASRRYQKRALQILAVSMDIMTPVTSLELACPTDVYKCHGIFICEADNEGKGAHPPAICSASFKSLPLWMLLAVLFHRHPLVMQERGLSI